MKSIRKYFSLVILILLFFSSNVFSNTINEIKITGNDRVSSETIKLFISKNVNDKINDAELNKILKDLYETNFFKDINVKFENKILSIYVLENPIIENIYYNGVKSDKS
ncbi:POTRA domain-containing protein [Candidatus Pelagibacter bacterium nBUS_25]|uniref:POTRA domain-containing protein n=1 Tax=Candidatus Pelagibacter bacterium nBUS_25 TaxID=3374187 RepID=UPI003EB9941B